MIKLRLSRIGHKNAPFYRIVVANARSKREGDALDYVGTYDPKTKPSTVTVDKVKVNEWIKKGALPTETVKALLVREGVLPKTSIVKKVFNSKPGKKKAAKAAK
jgi:small subunit ribosomal protein S16